MGEMVASALAQEGVSRVSSYISSKIDDSASRAHNLARLEMALSRLEFVLERTRKMPITYVSLIRRWNKLICVYKEGIDLLNKHNKEQALEEGHEEAGQVVVRGSSSSYLQRIARAARFSISSLAGLNKQCLSSSTVQIFESFADHAKEFVTDVESVCPLRRDTFFPYPFVRELLEGKTLRYKRIQGKQWLTFGISPFISEGRGVEAWLSCACFYPERQDKNFSLWLMLRLSESTDIVGTAIDCLRSSASLLNLGAIDCYRHGAILRELALLSNLRDNDISSAYCYDNNRFLALISFLCRRDPLCCQANGHVGSTMPSELSQSYFEEQITYFHFSCHIPALEYSLRNASDEAGRNVMTDRPPLKLTVTFEPHTNCWTLRELALVSEIMGDKIIERHGSITETMGDKEEDHPFGNIQQTADMVRSRSVDCLIHQPEMMIYSLSWYSIHGHATFQVEKPSTNMAAVPKARGRYNTRSAGKRKRPSTS